VSWELVTIALSWQVLARWSPPAQCRSCQCIKIQVRIGQWFQFSSTSYLLDIVDYHGRSHNGFCSGNFRTFSLIQNNNECIVRTDCNYFISRSTWNGPMLETQVQLGNDNIFFDLGSYY
jgi:hypothetical protein